VQLRKADDERMTNMSDSANGRTSGRRTLVDEGTEFKGTIKSSCPVVVAGRVEGDISGPSIEIAEKGFVSGTVKAPEVVSRGEVSGQIDAENLELSGKIRDGTVIRARSLDIKVGRVGPRELIQFGECELSIGEEPNKAAAIARAGADSSSQDARSAPPPVAPAATALSDALARGSTEKSPELRPKPAADPGRPV
jgi:cytoskeletal protein CcmA (bactofilin family)